jgi:hypothetical protein
LTNRRKCGIIKNEKNKEIYLEDDNFLEPVSEKTTQRLIVTQQRFTIEEKKFAKKSAILHIKILVRKT